jgi:hypothetical protein
MNKIIKILIGAFLAIAANPLFAAHTLNNNVDLLVINNANQKKPIAIKSVNNKLNNQFNVAAGTAIFFSDVCNNSNNTNGAQKNFFTVYFNDNNQLSKCNYNATHSCYSAVPMFALCVIGVKGDICRCDKELHNETANP